MKFKYIFLCAYVCVAGCATVKTKVLDESAKNIGRGLTYYLPTSDLKFTIIVEKPPSQPTYDDFKAMAQKEFEAAAKLEMDANAKSGNGASNKHQLKLANIHSENASQYMDKANKAKDNQNEAKKDLVIKDVAVETTPLYPDLTRGFTLKQQSNYIRRSASNIGVSEIGLLNSAQVVVTETPTIPTNSEGSGTTISPIVSTEVDCKKAGTYIVVKKISDMVKRSVNKFCGGDIIVELETINYPKRDNDFRVAESGSIILGKSANQKNGVFYRQMLPLKVTVDFSGVKKKIVVFSPAELEPSFLPIAKTLFANNQSTFTFKDGVLINHIKDVDGEVTSLFTIPAEILSEYFTAIGNVYGRFNEFDESRTNAISNQFSNEIRRDQVGDCSRALADGDENLLIQLNCLPQSE